MNEIEYILAKAGIREADEKLRALAQDCLDRYGRHAASFLCRILRGTRP